ncbi:hypothetical protein ARMSODRAFT_844126, partial [Armillaria solidipes]
SYSPEPLTTHEQANILHRCVSAMQPSEFEESGYTVCGQLVPLNRLSRSKHVSCFFSVLNNDACTRKEQSSVSELVACLDGPVIDRTTDLICLDCRASVHKGVVPKNAFTGDLWLGEIPKVLSHLSFVERMLISYVHHNCCFVRVALAG